MFAGPGASNLLVFDMVSGPGASALLVFDMVKVEPKMYAFHWFYKVLKAFRASQHGAG